MEIIDYIKVYPKFLNENVNDSLHKVCQSGHFVFTQASVIRNNKLELDLNARSTEHCNLKSDPHTNFTTIHWSHYLYAKFTKVIEKYNKEIDVPTDVTINDIQALRYTPGGFYRFHWDHGTTTPRTLSLIYFVNDDYEGGDLIFKFWGKDKQIKIKKEKNVLIVWPSNFMYPHTVTDVEKGTRFSIVSWAL